MEEIFGIICLFFNILFYLSLILPSISLASETVTFKESPFILLITAFFNSLFNGIYGLKNDLNIFWISNFIGSFITIIFIIIFIIFLSKQKIVISLIFNIITLAIIVIVFFISYSLNKINIIQIIGIIFNILMYIALNEKIYFVYHSNDYHLIPIFSGIFGLISAVIWLIYSVTSKNKTKYNIIPYIFGIIFSLLQIILYYLFYSKQGSNSNNFEKKKLVEAEIQSFESSENY